MVYTLGEAARATGKSKATISKAIKTAAFLHEKMKQARFILTHRNYIEFTHQPFLVNTEKPLKTPQKSPILAGLSGSYRHVLKRRMNACPTRKRS